jgi:hypothetical protein
MEAVMKKDAYWFSHDSNAKDDPKSMKLIDQLGLEGYGIFWVLIEVLRDQPEFRYPIELLPILARRYNTSGEKMKAVVSSYGLFSIDAEDNFFSISLNDRMQILEGHREQRRIAGLKSAAARAKKQLPQSTTVKQSLNDRSNDGQLSKVKESKVKNSKVKESKEEKIDSQDPLDPSYQYNPNTALIKKWSAWVAFRKALKKPYKTKNGEAAAYNRLTALAAADSEVAIAIIQQSMDREWIDFYPLKTSNGSIANSGEDPVQKDIRLTREARAARIAAEAAQKMKVDDMINDLELENLIENGN